MFFGSETTLYILTEVRYLIILIPRYTEKLKLILKPHSGNWFIAIFGVLNKRLFC